MAPRSSRGEIVLASVVALVLAGLCGTSDAPASSAHRYTAESLSAGRVPLWNDLQLAGVPWLANPRAGVLDPSVWCLAAFERCGGPGSFERGAAWLACLHVAFAGLGAFVLARRLGLARAPAALAGVGFGGAGALVATLGTGAGHVAPLVPWLLVAVDRLRDAGSARRVAVVALALALTIVSGDPESASFAGLSALAWAAFALEGRARNLAFVGLALGVLAAAPQLVPLIEALRESNSIAARAAADAARGFDWVALVLLLLFAVLVVAWRRLDVARWSDSKALASGFGIAVAAAVCISILADRGLDERARAFVIHDALRTETWSGRASLVRTWVASAVLALSFASFLSARGALRGRRVVHVAAAAASALALGLPGVVDAWRLAPFLGLASTSGAASVAALGLALAAGEALQSAARPARRTAALVTVVLLGLALLARDPAPPSRTIDPPDELVSISQRPAEVLRDGRLLVAGTLSARVPCDGLALRIERLNAAGNAPAGAPRLLALALSEADAEGLRAFRDERVLVSELEAGTYLVALDVLRRGADGHFERAGSRQIAWSVVAPRPVLGGWAALFALAAFVSVLFLAGTKSPIAWLVVASALVQSILLARDLAGSRPPEDEATATVNATLAVLDDATSRAARPAARVFIQPGALPERVARAFPGPSGVNSLTPRRFDALRASTLRPDADPSRGFDPRDVDLSSPAFRLLGVEWLVTHAPVTAPGFVLEAGPNSAAPRQAERHVYRAESPVPRAFCVTQVVERANVARDPRHFDPEREAFLEPDDAWRPAHEAGRTRVETLAYQPESARHVVETDGEALLVVTDQAYPGWRARVDGVPAPIHVADGTFRGVALSAGTHAVEFEYAPASVRIGTWIGLVALVAIWILALVPRRAGPGINASLS